ncbi:unnamed protein product [Protopolystoma xenopodis]|uniref:Uncharacterized protein n=1 Tax=Protopolystoma xenopodis TaxID=117903 RepID=A0A448X6Q6_9PLAT|nr:unnamed protein product [Protopolystoma xenopodis]
MADLLVRPRHSSISKVSNFGGDQIHIWQRRRKAANRKSELKVVLIPQSGCTLNVLSTAGPEFRLLRFKVLEVFFSFVRQLFR